MAGRKVLNMDKGKAPLTSTDDDPDDSFVFEIDPKWFLDATLLTLGMQSGEGANSTVLKGLYNSDPVAVKVIELEKSSTGAREKKEKFQREVLVLTEMDHENVIKLIGVTVEPMRIVTELAEGGTLENYLNSIRPNCLDLKLAIRFALDISRAMEYLHDKGFLHRDLKPDNILLTEDKMHIKLAEFGLAREEVADGMTCEVGTYRWMAPELLNLDQDQDTGKKRYDHKADVFSFSMVLWELLTNKMPYEGMQPIAAGFQVAMNRRPSLEDLPTGIAPILKSCWDANPKARPEFTEIIDMLTKFQNLNLTVSTIPPPPPPLPETQEDENLGPPPPRGKGYHKYVHPSLIIPVLLLLPFKALSRFKCVSKYWKNKMIMSKEFCDAYAPERVLFLAFDTYYTTVKVDDLLSGQTLRSTQRYQYPTWLRNPSSMRLAGSCMGVLSFFGPEGEAGTGVWLWNVARNESREVITFNDLEPIHLGLAFHSTTGEFSVVRLFKTMVEVVTMSTRGALRKEYYPFDFGTPSGNGVWFKDQLHWLCRDKKNAWILLSFHIETGTFQPKALPTECEGDDKELKLSKLGKDLGLTSKDNSFNMQIWVWFAKNRQGWRLLYEHPTGLVIRHFPLILGEYKLVIINRRALAVCPFNEEMGDETYIDGDLLLQYESFDGGYPMASTLAESAFFPVSS